MEALPEIPDWILMEHQAAQILQHQEEHGWYFDEQSAWELESTLRGELEKCTKVLRDEHPFVAGTLFNPKRDNRTQGYVAGCESTRLKQLNPTSRDHIAWILTTHYGWKASSTTSSGKPVIDEVVLKELGTDIALRFLHVLELTKMLGMISEGVNAWLKLCTNERRIHHHCSVGAATHRCAHRKPNLAQTPSDPRCRSLFIPTPGLIMVGADLSGIELRMLAHYLARYDGGRYAKILLEDDIHQVNADKIGISRKLVKNVTYAFLYGAGDLKIGLTYDKQLPTNKARAKGKEIKAAYVAAIPGLDKLLAAIKKSSERGYIKAIDGRKILLDRSFKALNYLLQGSAGCIAKRWMCIADDRIKDQKLDAHQLAFIHDELQYESTPDHVKHTMYTLETAASHAGKYYELRLPIAAEAKSGMTWQDVH